jgi:hypothetical protein
MHARNKNTYFATFYAGIMQKLKMLLYAKSEIVLTVKQTINLTQWFNWDAHCFR